VSTTTDPSQSQVGKDQGSSSGAAYSLKEKLLFALERLSLGKAAALVISAGMLTFVLLHFVARPLAGINLPLGGDAYDGYLQLAQNLVRGNGYVFEPGGAKVFHRPPLYPLLLIPAGLLSETAARCYVVALNSVLLAIGGTILRLIGREIFTERIGAVAWLIFCFNPFILWACKMAMAPICQTTAYLLVIWTIWRFFLKIRNGESISRRFGFFCALGLLAAVMCHGTMLTSSLLFLSTLAYYALKKSAVQAFRAVLGMFFIVTVSVLPWSWRNYKVTGQFMPVAGNAGLAYFAGNSHWGIGGPACAPGEDRRRATLRHAGFIVNHHTELLHFYGFREPEKERLANERAKKDILTHPLDFLKKLGLNAIEYYLPVIYFLFPPPGTYASQVSLAVALRTEANIDIVPLSIYYFGLLMMSAAGFIYLRKRRAMRFQLICLTAMWAIFAVPYFPFLTYVGHGLYTFGSVPALALFAGVWFVRPKELAFRWDR
jgi:hypothetical protein